MFNERSGGNVVTFLAVGQPHGVQCSPLVGDGPPDLSPALLTTDLHDVRGNHCPRIFVQIENVPRNTEHAMQVTLASHFDLDACLGHGVVLPSASCVGYRVRVPVVHQLVELIA